MMFSQKWKAAFDQRDKNALAAMIDDDFVYLRHQTGADMDKEQVVNAWSKFGPRPERRDYRVVYENDEILVTHQFMDFPNGDKESVMVVMLIKDGKLCRMETGATPLSA